jgi:hypothetical protein
MRYSIFFLLLIFLSSCEGVKVTNDWDKKVDFHQFKTYSLYPWDKHNSQIVNDFDKQTILTAIKGEMEKRGYAYSEDKGELVVSTFVMIEDKASYQAYTNHYGGWAGYGGGWGYYGGIGIYGYGAVNASTTIYETDYEQGTLIIDIFTLHDKKLVWQGIGTGEVTDDMDKRDHRLPETITAIFRRYPVTPMSKKKLEELNEK